MADLRPFLNDSICAILKDELESLGWTSIDFAQELDMSVKELNEIITSKTALKVETAQLIGRILGTSSFLLLNIDKNYHLR